MRVLICAGGTGGGIYPALTAATELCNLGLSREQILWVGARGEMEEDLVLRAGLELETVFGGAIVGVPPHVMIMNGTKLAWSFGLASRIIRRFKPDVMFMTGGYIAAPVAIACRLLRVPICIFLPDVEPASTIKRVMPMAQKVACTSEGSRAYVPAEKIVVTGYPVRPELRAAAKLSRVEALARFGLAPGRPALFVFGGSRGARNINRALMAVLPQLLAQVQIIHISGVLTWPEVETNAETLPAELRAFYRPYPYLHEEMGAAFRAADLVLSRAGASMLGECPAFGIPAVLVPYPYAWRYQRVNANYLTERGAAIQLTDDQLPGTLLPMVSGLLQNKDKLVRMSAAARALDAPDAAANLAHLIMAVGQGKAQRAVHGVNT